jgi:glycerophosphoryl diester phosphodiesterase
VTGRPLVLGHRGASAAEPENTLAAYARARAMGADGVELDVRRTSDRVLVVHHDAHLDGVGLVVERPFAEVRAARSDVPTLDEALAECAGMLVNVEIKCCAWEPDADTPDREVVRATVETIRARGANVIVSSFDLEAVDACRALAPELTTAWLTGGKELLDAARTAVAHGHAWLHPDRTAALAAPAGDVDAVHALGCSIDVWTVDDPAEIGELAARGVDGIITNVPDVALAALAERR